MQFLPSPVIRRPGSFVCHVEALPEESAAEAALRAAEAHGEDGALVDSSVITSYTVYT